MTLVGFRSDQKGNRKIQSLITVFKSMDKKAFHMISMCFSMYFSNVEMSIYF